jgi:hypothetical protein
MILRMVIVALIRTHMPLVTVTFTTNSHSQILSRLALASRRNGIGGVRHRAGDRCALQLTSRCRVLTYICRPCTRSRTQVSPYRGSEQHARCRMKNVSHTPRSQEVLSVLNHLHTFVSSSMQHAMVILKFSRELPSSQISICHILFRSSSNFFALSTAASSPSPVFSSTKYPACACAPPASS